MNSNFEYNALIEANRNLKATSKKLFEEVYKYYQMIENYELYYEYIHERKTERVSISEQVNYLKYKVACKTSQVAINFKKENQELKDMIYKLTETIKYLKEMIEQYKVIYDIFIYEEKYELDENNLTFEYQKN